MKEIKIENADYNSCIETLHKPYKGIVYNIMHSHEHYDTIVCAFTNTEDAEKFCANKEYYCIVKTYIL